MTPGQQRLVTRALQAVGLLCVIGGVLPVLAALTGLTSAPVTPAGWVATALLGLPALILGCALLGLAFVVRRGGFA